MAVLSSIHTLLLLVRLGDPILREVMPRLSVDEIKSDQVQTLIANIRYTNARKVYGVGLAAPQVGERFALSVIGIKPTPTRPELEPFECVIINPSYEGIGEAEFMWEGCQSIGSGDDVLYGQVPRYGSVHATWHDEAGVLRRDKLTGFQAHVFQHETDHLNGVLFIDKVADTHSLMMADEYQKRVVKSGQAQRNT